MDLFRLAWRNVWRNRRRTLVSVGAMSLALLAMVVYAGLMEGFLRGMERNVLDLEVGDIQVFAQNYRAEPSIYERIEEPSALLGPLEDAGLRASARVLAFGIASTGDASAAVSFRGIDIERDARVSRIHEQLAAGRWLDAADPRGVVVGRRLARMLGVAPGDELVVLSQGADGAMAYDLFHVRGVLHGVGDAVDRTGIFLPAQTLRELLVVDAGAHQIIVRRAQGTDLAGAAAQVRALAGAFDVQTWRQLMPTVASMIDSARGLIVAMFFIVYVTVGILILNAMLMAVFERVREFGVLKALGVGPLEVLGMVFIESAIQTSLAIAVGLGLAVPALWYLTATGIDLGNLAGVSVMGVAMDPIWRAAVTPEAIVQPVGVLVTIVALAVVYPALKAAWIEPVDAIHHH